MNKFVLTLVMLIYPVIDAVSHVSFADDIASDTSIEKGIEEQMPSIASSHDEPIINLKAIIEEAIANNPEIVAVKKRLDSSRARVKQALSLDDPMLQFQGMNVPDNPFRLDKDIMKDMAIMSPLSLGVSQTLPFPGKLRLKGKIAMEDVNINEMALFSKIQEITARTKAAYYDLYLAYKSMEINKKNIELLKDFSHIAEAKYATGVIQQQDVLTAHVELSRLIVESIHINRQKEQYIAELNALLNRSAQYLIGIPEEIAKGESVINKIDALEEFALTNRPLLKGLSHAVKKGDNALALAKKEYFPDPNISIAYNQIDKTSDTWATSFSFNIPWLWSKKRYMIKEAKEELSAINSDYKAMVNMTIFDTKRLIEEIKEFDKIIEIYKTTIIPQSEQTLKVTRIGYENGTADFLILINSQRVLLENELKYYESLVNYKKAIAELEKVVGIGLE